MLTGRHGSRDLAFLVMSVVMMVLVMMAVQPQRVGRNGQAAEDECCDNGE